MKRKVTVGCLTLLIAAFAAFWVFSEVTFWRPARRARARILAADHEAIASACRELMADALSYTNAPSHFGHTWISKDSPVFWNRLPAAIADLDPHHVSLETNMVLVCFRGPPCRVYLKAFPSGVETNLDWSSELTAGLWLY